MTIRKTILRLDGDGSAALTDTGQFPVYGSIDQVRWVPNAQDTGPANIGTLSLFLGHRPVDTGLDVLVWSQTGLVLGNDITRVPRQPVHTAAGAAIDTGGDFSEPVYGYGDALTARFTPGDTGLIAGELHVLHGAVGGPVGV
jgi:hypothetical protein